jgi:hypothetical protein
MTTKEVRTAYRFLAQRRVKFLINYSTVHSPTQCSDSFAFPNPPERKALSI